MRVVEVAPRTTAVIALVTDWATFPQLWPQLLAEVWEVLRAGDGAAAAGRNVMLYKDDRPAVEVGVELDAEVKLGGRLTRSTLPGGSAAMTLAPGPPTRESLRAAHHEIADFCARIGATRASPRFEIYSHHSDVPDENHTEIYRLLR